MRICRRCAPRSIRIASRCSTSLDPGPDGSLGDVSWVIEARKSGRVQVLIYQGVLQTELSKIADVVLPGSAWVEKDATYTNEQGLVQAASKAINAPGESVEDWQILTSVAAALGLPYTYTTSQQVRADVARTSSAQPEYATLDRDRVQSSGQRRALAQGQQPDGTLEVGHDVPGPAAGEGPQRADGADVDADGDSAAPRNGRDLADI